MKHHVETLESGLLPPPGLGAAGFGSGRGWGDQGAASLPPVRAEGSCFRLRRGVALPWRAAGWRPSVRHRGSCRGWARAPWVQVKRALRRVSQRARSEPQVGSVMQETERPKPCPAQGRLRGRLWDPAGWCPQTSVLPRAHCCGSRRKRACWAPGRHFLFSPPRPALSGDLQES